MFFEFHLFERFEKFEKLDACKHVYSLDLWCYLRLFFSMRGR